MKSISVGELRQNPTRMLDEVEAGESYRVTRHHRDIAHIVPVVSSAAVIPARRTGPADTSSLTRVELPNGLEMDEFLDDLKGDW